MPTTRHRVSRAPAAGLSAVQSAYLLDQALPPLSEWREGWLGDAWWLICAVSQTSPRKAWFDNPRTGNCVSAIVLWQRYRAQLLPRWRELHGSRRHPLERGKQPPTAARSARERLDELIAQQRERDRPLPSLR